MSIKRKAGGFRNPSHFTTAIYFHCGGARPLPTLNPEGPFLGQVLPVEIDHPGPTLLCILLVVDVTGIVKERVVCTVKNCDLREFSCGVEVSLKLSGHLRRDENCPSPRRILGRVL